MGGARLAAMALGAVLAGCGESQTPAPLPLPWVGTQLAVRQELTRAIDQSPRNLDPTLSTDIPAERVMDDLFEGLTTLDEAGQVVPAVASHWETSADGLHYTFHLRPGVEWSNGVPIKAGDFIYAWRRLVDPKTGADYAQSLAPVKNALAIAAGKLPVEALGISAPDERTLEVTLDAPTPYFLWLLTKAFTYPLYEPVIRQYGDDWVRPEHIVGNGAFLLKEQIIGSRVVEVRNPRYRDAAQVKLERVTWYPVDRSVQTDRFIAGDIEFTESFSAMQRSWLRAKLGDQVVSAPYLGTLMLAFNMRRAPFAGNRALRQALNLAVDREILTARVRQGLYQPAWSLTPPISGYGPVRPDWQSLDRKARLARARELYAAAGYSPAHPLRVELTYPTDSDNLRTMEAITAMWRENLGAEVSLHNEEFKVYLNNRRTHQLPLFFFAWIGDFPDPYTFQQLFQSGFGINDGEHADPAYDALLMQANAQADIGRRYALQAEAEARLNEDACYIPLYYYASRHLIKPWVRGWQSNLSDRNLSRYLYVLEHH